MVDKTEVEIINSLETKNVMTKEDYLRQLRRCSKLDTLDKVAELKASHLSDQELCVFYGAFDHRKIEIITGRLYDKIPKSAWSLI